MSLAEGYLAEFKRLCSEVDRKFSRLNTRLSELDREVSAVYHEIERTDFTKVDGHYAAVLLQRTLQKRRVVKCELAQLRPIHSAISSQTDHCRNAEEKYRKQAKKVEEIRISLNATLTIEDIGGITL